MKIAIIGGGPAGLMAAEAAIGGGAQVDLYDAMPSVGRKFLLAGKGGLNLTHSEPFESFLSRYGSRRRQLEPLLTLFGPDALQRWARSLGIDTFVGTSGRIFPKNLKAAPLLRVWLKRLRRHGVRFHVRHRWMEWNEQGALICATPKGTLSVKADAVILALGGASWPKFGSDGGWTRLLADRGVPVAPLGPANCGFDVRWTEHMKKKFAGHPVKSMAVMVTDCQGKIVRQQGEFVVTETGVEGGLIYGVSAILRDEIEATGSALLRLDLAPEHELAQLVTDLSKPRGKRTVSAHLQRQTGIAGVKSALLHEVVPKQDFNDPMKLAAAIKALPLTLIAPRPLEEAISSAGGVVFDALDERLMIRALPGVFCAGEMLDWEAPTGGYLLTACFASGRAAGAGAVDWLVARS